MKSTINFKLSSPYFSLVFCFIMLSACVSNDTIIKDNVNQQASFRTFIPLSGTWKFLADDIYSSNQYSPLIDDKLWDDIKVPANWYLEGHDISGVAWYRKHFKLNRKFEGKRVSVNFGGIDYAADIWLNGNYIGFHEGYFQAFSFDVTDSILFNEDNVLTVRVNSPLEKTGTDWSLHKRLIKGIFSHHDTRPGGAWSDRGQEQNTGGIWAAVDLEIYDIAHIQQVKISPKLESNNQKATAVVELDINLAQDENLSTTVLLSLNPHNFLSSTVASTQQHITLTPGENHVTFSIDIENPKLWWPWDQGKANLYALEMTLLNNAKVIDKTREVFGFRTIEYDDDKKIWLFNGKRIFLRGTNYIATQWLSEMSPVRYGRDISLMKDANINTIRVHAHVAAKEFYRQCDEEGMLVWQDFPLQWGYSDELRFHDNAIRQAKEMVDGFYNHPSIFSWSLINEPPWDADWMVYKYTQYNDQQNKELTEKMYAQIKPYDTTRYVHAFSSTAEHPWLGWYSGSWLDFNKPSTVPIVAEFGAQALPGLDGLRKIFDEADLWPTSQEQWDKWAYHNFQHRETFENAKLDMGKNPAEFVKNSQVYQAKLIKLAAESYRRQRYTPVNSIFQFMFVEDWPSMNWGVVDYWRIPKLGYYALQQAYQPVLPSIAWEQEHFKLGETVNFKLWAINDLLQDFPQADFDYSLRHKNQILKTESFKVDIAADSGVQVKELIWDDLPLGHFNLVVKIKDRDGNVLGVNTHEFDMQ